MADQRKQTCQPLPIHEKLKRRATVGKAYLSDSALIDKEIRRLEGVLDGLNRFQRAKASSIRAKIKRLTVKLDKALDEELG